MLADPTASAIVEFLPETENYAFTFAAAAENFKKLGIQPLEDDESRLPRLLVGIQVCNAYTRLA